VDGPETASVPYVTKCTFGVSSAQQRNLLALEVHAGSLTGVYCDLVKGGYPVEVNRGTIERNGMANTQHG
jgi:hypothetical protein